jgi:membrane dipeptidase
MNPPKNVAARAAELHRRAIVIDGHSDILMPIADGLVRLVRQVQIPDPERWRLPFEIPKQESEQQHWPLGNHFGCIGQYSLPQFLTGGLTAQVCAVFVEEERLDHALRRSLEMVWWLRREAEENDEFELVTTVADIQRLKRQGKCGGILALEGLEPLGYDLKLLDLFYALGVRMAGMAHNRRNYYSDGTQNNVQPGGLTEMGKQAIRRMNELGIVVDVAHMTPPCFWETLEISTAPVVLSHGSARRFYPRRPEDSPLHAVRDVSRGPERLQALARNGGVFGVFFLFRQADIDTVVAEIEYLWDVVGPDHVGLGSDLYGLDVAPKGLEDISKVPALTERLVARGHADDVILKLLGGNFLRIFQRVWRRASAS